jgi:dTDP-4-amino-4,6-dideoxygalactose transaminase
MNKPTFAPWPSFDNEIIDAVEKVLRSGKVSQWTGPNVYAFEEEYARYLGVKHAVAMTNGSVTMDVALKLLGIGPGDEVVVTCRSFVASASCVALTGALPVFADVDPVTGNMTAETIARVVTGKTKAVIVVHLAGWPCDMDSILRLCRSRKLFLIEDCAQAHGAKYKGKHVGTFGHFGSFSFCQDKIFTTGGEGGLLVTDNTRLWKKAWSLKDHGRDYDVVFNRKSGTGFVWMVNSFGTNYRMNDVQAAIGRIFLRRLDDMVGRRREYAAMLDDAFGKMESLIVARPAKGIEPAYYKYYVQVNPKKLKKGLTRDVVLQKLAALGVSCGCGACPEICREKAFRRQRKELGLAPQKRLPAARRLGENCIMLQVHPTLSKECIDYTIEAMKKVLG